MAGGVVGKMTTAGTGAGTHLLTSTFYGTCATAAGTAAKVVKLADSNINAATLITGMTIAVKFTYANSVANPTLTVQTNGGTQLIAAKSIMRYGTTAPSTSAATSWRAGAMVLLVYDGTNWVEVSSIDDNSTYTIPTSAASNTTGITASTTATKTTLGTAFTIPNVTAAGSASSWTFEEKTIPNVTAAGSGSFTSGTFSGGSGSFSATVTDHVLSYSHTHTAATHAADSHTHTAPTIGTAIKVQSKSGGSNGSAPTLGTAFTVPNVTGNTSATVSITDSGHTHTLS